MSTVFGMPYYYVKIFVTMNYMEELHRYSR